MPKFNNCSFLSIVFLLGVFITNAKAQELKIGPTFGGYFSNRIGVNTIDSIKVVTDGVHQEAVVGIFAEGKIRKGVVLRTELNFFENFIDYDIYNDVQECLFCPIIKGQVVSARTLELVILPKLQLPLNRLINLSVFGGPSVHFRFRSKEEGASGDLGRQHPGLTEVYNSLYESVTPMHVYLAYGASLDIWRLNLSARYVNTAQRSSLEEIEVYGKKYPILFKDKFLLLTVSYGFNLPNKPDE